MATFEGRLASSGPRIKKENANAVREIIGRYHLRCEDVTLTLEPDTDYRNGRHEPDGHYLLAFDGYDTPDVWRTADGADPESEDFDWDADGSGDCLEELMLAVAPYLEEPWVIQCIGAEKCRFPLTACEWRVEPGGKDVQFNSFTLDRAMVSKG